MRTPAEPEGTKRLELSTAWRDEIARRCAEMDEGKAELEDADEVFARIASLLDQEEFK